MKLRSITKWYHATSVDNAESILSDGSINLNAHGMVFLASTRDDAGFFLNARGQYEYAVFEIHRRDLDLTKLFVNPAAKGMFSSVYYKPIAVTARQCKIVRDQRDLTQGIGGVKLFTNGNGKTGFTINPAEFDGYLLNKIGADNFAKFQNMIHNDYMAAEKFLESVWETNHA